MAAQSTRCVLDERHAQTVRKRGSSCSIVSVLPLLSLLVLSLPAAAAPIAIPLSNFSDLETAVDFNTLGFEDEVTNQFASDGVSNNFDVVVVTALAFSGGLLMDTLVLNYGIVLLSARPRN